MKQKTSKNGNNQLESLVELLTRAATLDFSQRAIITDATDSLNAVATGVNMLMDELEARAVSEKEREEKNRVLRTLMKNLPGVAYHCPADMDWQPDYMSEGCLSLTGFSSEEFKSKPWSSIVHPEDLERVRQVISVAIEQKADFEIEYRIVHTHGFIVHVVGRGGCHLDEQGKVIALEGLIVDVTPQVQARDTLHISEEKYRAIVEETPDAILAVDLKQRVQFWNKGGEKIFGYAPKDVIGKDFFDFVPEHRRTQAEKEFNEVLKAGTLKGIASEAIAKNGSIIPIEVSATVLKNEHGELIGVSTVIRDVSERKDAEKMLLQSERKYRDLYESSLIGMYTTTNKDRKALNVNSKGASIFGCASKEDFIQNFSIPDSYVDQEVRQTLIKEILKTGSAHEFEVELKQKDGTKFWALLNVRVDVHGGTTEVSIVDITTVKEAESIAYRALIEGQEKERKRLAMEIHDQLGQDLAGIKLGLHHLQRQMETFTLPIEDRKEFNRTTHQLLEELTGAIGFTRSLGQELFPPILHVVGLKEALEDLVARYGSSFKEINFALELPQVLKNPNIDMGLAIYRIVQEGLTNVVKHAEATEVSVFIVAHDDKLYVRISDNGKGITAEKMNGRGLGIRGMRERVLALSGTLSITNANGTVIDIAVPI